MKEKINIEVTHMSGAGNYFSVIDNRDYGFTHRQCARLAPLLCQKNDINKFETEGLLVISESEDETEFKAGFYNPDGSTEVMCGNGARCAVNFAAFNRFFSEEKEDKEIYFEMANKVYKSRLNRSKVQLYLPPPEEIIRNIELELDGQKIIADFVDVNSDHLVINTEQMSEMIKKTSGDFLEKYGPELRHHERFAPRGVNVNFYSMDNDIVMLRTYERGVEGETGACGTGAVSTALIAAFKDQTHFPVSIIPPSTSPLTVDIEGEFPDNIGSMMLEGGAEELGTVAIKVPRDKIFK